MESACKLDSYIDSRIELLRSEGRNVTADNYGKARRCLYRYCQNHYGQDPYYKDRYCQEKELSLADITEDFVAGFNAYLEGINIQKATISFYNRILRSIYNQAVKDGLVKNTHPFDGAYTKVVAKLSPVQTVKTPTGESVEASELTKDELLHQYLTLRSKYNRLVNQLSAMVGV